MIKLSKVKPEPIFSLPQVPPSDIWDKELTFEKGESYLVTAPSGKGKSTLVHAIIGYRKDYEGEVFCYGENVKSLSPEKLTDIRRNKVSVVFQDLKLIPGMTGLENIEMSLELSGTKNSDEAKSLIQQLGLEGEIEKPVEKLSYGQRQRVAIISALLHPFDFLILDEPFSHLDEENIITAKELIEGKVKEKGAGLLLVSHERDYGFSFDKKFTL